MKLSELKTLIDKESRKWKKEKADPEVRFLILPNFPTALSVRSELVSSLDSSLSNECRGQGNFIYLAEDKDEGAVYGEITERFGWGVKTAWKPGVKPPETPNKNGKKKAAKNKSLEQLQDIVDSTDEVEEKVAGNGNG